MGLPRRVAASVTASALFVFAAPVGAATAAAGPALPKFKSGSWIVADADTGQVLAAKNAHGRFLPASTQKVLTAVTLIPRLAADQRIKPTQLSCEPEGTKVGMTPKLTYKAADLFRAMLMVSANDAAMTLTLPQGGMKPTLKLMNDEAARLGAKDTLAGSPNGLDVDLGLSVKTQYTTAYDLATILRAGLRIPEFVEYAATVNATFPAQTAAKTNPKTKKKTKPKNYAMPIYSHVRLLPTEAYAYPGFIAGKNGYTNAAGQTFVGAAKRNGRTLIVAMMKSEVLWANATKLFDWGFANAGNPQSGERLPEAQAADAPSASPRDSAPNAAGPGDSSDGDGGGRSSDLLLGGVGAAFILAGVGVLVIRRRVPSSS